MCNGVSLGYSILTLIYHNIVQKQEEINYAVESVNTHYFVDLGGVFYYDINFVGKNGFPLKIAAMKGR